ncbi:hypothetical protein ACVIWV_007870 [Bradyrhizobium diazoefficiens]
MTPEETGLAPAGLQPARTIECGVELTRLRDAWRAASTVSGDGTFTLAISRDSIRLLAQGEVAVEATVPIANTTGITVGEELHLNLSSDSLAALGHGDLDESGKLLFGEVQLEEGFVGILRLQTSFTVTWPYTLTKVGSVTIDDHEGLVLQSVDPRTVRQTLAEIRNFAGDNDRAGNNLNTLQIWDQEALGMSPSACQSVKSDRLTSVCLRVPAFCAKVLGILLTQLKSSETQLGVSGEKCVLLDGRLTIIAPMAPPLPSWPDNGPATAQFQLDVTDFTAAVAAIVWQAPRDNPIITLGVGMDAQALTLSTAVPGGMAMASCSIASANRVQPAEVSLRFGASTLSSFSTRNNDAVQFRVFERFVEIEQVSPGERRRTLLAVERARSYS